MSRTIGSTLPAAFVEAFDGTLAEDRVGLGYVLVTTDADGRPRPAMLSAGEILATGDHTVRLAMWSGSTSADNLVAGRPCFLTYVGPGLVLHLHGAAKPLVAEGNLTCVEMTVDRVDSDSHPGLPTQQTITYTCQTMTPHDVLDEWRESLDALHRATPADGDGPKGAQ